MPVIYKYELIPGAEVWIAMPKDAKILSTAFQGSKLYVWAAVDPETPMVSHHFEVVMTGREAPLLYKSFIGIAMTLDETFVAHVYDLGDTIPAIKV